MVKQSSDYKDTHPAQIVANGDNIIVAVPSSWYSTFQNSYRYRSNRCTYS